MLSSTADESRKMRRASSSRRVETVEGVRVVRVVREGCAEEDGEEPMDEARGALREVGRGGREEVVEREDRRDRVEGEEEGCVEG
jgi:hypothetical protein